MQAKRLSAAVHRGLNLLKLSLLFSVIAAIVGGGFLITGLPFKTVFESTGSAGRSKITGFKMTEKTAGRDRWNLSADTVFMNVNTREMEKVRMRFISAKEGATPVEMNADAALVQDDTLNIDFKGNVVVRTQDPITLFADKLHWKQGEHQFTTDDTVKMEIRGGVITGTGIIADVGEQKFTFVNAVHGIFSRGT